MNPNQPAQTTQPQTTQSPVGTQAFTPPVQTVPVNPTPPSIPQVSQPIIAPTPKSSNKMLLSMIIVMFFLAVGIGTYIYMNQQQSSQQVAQTTPQREAPTAVPTAAQIAEERETELIDIGTLDADFADIDNDLQSL